MSNNSVELWVSGIEPAPQGSKRYVGGNRASGGRFIEASKKLEPFRVAIGMEVHRYMADTPGAKTFTEPVEVEATFVLPRPKTVTRPWPSVAPDTDKLQRALGDSISLERYCLGPALLADDALIVMWTAQKIYGTKEEMGVYFKVKPATLPFHLG